MSYDKYINNSIVQVGAIKNILLSIYDDIINETQDEYIDLCHKYYCLL